MTHTKKKLKKEEVVHYTNIQASKKLSWNLSMKNIGKCWNGVEIWLKALCSNNDGKDTVPIITNNFFGGFLSSLLSSIIKVCLSSNVISSSITAGMDLFKSFYHSLYCSASGTNFRVSTLYRLKECYNSIMRRMINVPRRQSAYNLESGSYMKLWDRPLTFVRNYCVQVWTPYFVSWWKAMRHLNSELEINGSILCIFNVAVFLVISFMALSWNKSYHYRIVIIIIITLHFDLYFPSQKKSRHKHVKKI